MSKKDRRPDIDVFDWFMVKLEPWHKLSNQTKFHYVVYTIVASMFAWELISMIGT